MTAILSAALALSLHGAAKAALGTTPGTVVVSDHSGALRTVVHPEVARRAYPIGSLAKLVTAGAALQKGVIGPSETLECRGMGCWGVHGRVDMEGAIAESCSSYFRRVGSRLGGQALINAFRQSGISAPLPRTRTDVEALACGDTTVLRASPLQVARMAAAITRTGSGTLKAGMRRAVIKGSARLAGTPDRDLAGKTGTAPRPDAPHRRYGWFAGYDAERVVVVFVKDGTGYRHAAPIARRVWELSP